MNCYRFSDGDVGWWGEGGGRERRTRPQAELGDRVGTCRGVPLVIIYKKLYKKRVLGVRVTSPIEMMRTVSSGLLIS